MKHFGCIKQFIYESAFNERNGGKMNTDFSDAVHKFGGIVYKIAFIQCGTAHDAEDIFQEVFLALHKTNTDFNDDEHLKAWLIRVTLNKCRMLKRSAWFRKRTELSEAEAVSENGRTDKDEAVYNAVMRLNAKYREVVVLYYYEDYSCDEISKILETKSSTVRTRLARARALLKKDLKEVWKDE